MRPGNARANFACVMAVGRGGEPPQASIAPPPGNARTPWPCVMRLGNARA